MKIEEFDELDDVKDAIKKLQDIRDRINNYESSLQTLRNQKKELYCKIGELAEEHELDLFYPEV